MGLDVSCYRLVAEIPPFMIDGNCNLMSAPMKALLSIHFMKRTIMLSDIVMHGSSHDMLMCREPWVVDDRIHCLPYMSTISRFCHTPHKLKQAVRTLPTVNLLLCAKVLLLRRGASLKTRLLSAPNSINNARDERNPE